MRIAYVCYDYPPGPNGGIGRFTQVLGRELVARGHVVRVIGIYPPGYDAPDRQDDDGVQVWRLRDHGGPGSWVLARWRLYRRLRGWARAGDVDLIEAPDCYGWFAGWPSLPVPLVTRAHGSLTYFADEMGREPDRTGHRLEASSLRRTDRWVAVSEHVGRRTRQLFHLAREPDAVIYNPVPLPARSSVHREGGRVVFTGTLTEKKGVLALADAWPRVLEAVPQARLDLVGKDQPASGGGSMSARILARLPAAARSSVTMHGHLAREGVEAALRRATVAVFPSFSESFGLGAAEAMAHGCPTVYTSRTCGPEILRHGLDGLLADPGDPAALADAIVTLLRDPVRAAELGRSAASRVAERFGLGAVTGANEAFYARVLQEERR